MSQGFLSTLAGVTLAFALVVGATAAETRYELGDPVFHTVAGAEAIPENVAGNITQDLRGFLWIGSPDGLVRYDGYTFRTFRHDPKNPKSLIENHVRTLHAAPDGRLWVGTGDAGISLFDPLTETFRNFTAAADGLSDDNIRDFADGPGGVYVATTAGLDFIDEKTLRVSPVDVRPPDAPSPDRAKLGGLFLDDRGDLWIGTADGLTVRRKDGRLEAIALKPAGGDSLAGVMVYRVFGARDGALWLGLFGGGIARLDRDTGIVKIIDRTVRSAAMAQPEENTIWVGTTNNGIEVRDARSGEMLHRYQHDPSVPESLVSNRVNSLFIDRSGITWIGTTGRGLARYNVSDDAFRIVRQSPLRPDGLTNNEVESVFESSDGLLWVGTHDNGVDVFDATRRVHGIRAGNDSRSVSSPNVGAIAETPDGIIWLGAFASLDRLDRRTGVIERHDLRQIIRTAGRVTTIVPTPDGSILWIGTSGGLLRFDVAPRRWSTVEFEDGKRVSGTVTDIALDPQGRLWVTSLTWIATLAPGETKFRRFTHEQNSGRTLPPGSAIDLLFDSKGTLWVGMSNGLMRLQRFDGKTASFESIAPRLGLENRRCDNLLEDGQGRIWIEDGLVFDPASFARRSFGTDEGAGRSIWRGAAIRTRSGQFVMGGPDGLFVIDPDRVHPWRYVPPVVLTSLSVDGVVRPTAATARLALEPSNKSVTFEFAALDFSAPHRNRYAYRLQGFDRGWTEVDASHRQATYTSLPPGDYTFEVRGSNRDGVWNSASIAVPLHVTPAFYETTWFRLLVALLLVGLTWPLYRMRVRMLEARQRELEALVERRTAQLKESEHRALEASEAKTVFLANMSHELRTPLNATLGFARLMQRSSTLSPSDRQNLSIVEKSGEHLLSLINQVLSISKIEAGRMTLDTAVFDLRAMIDMLDRMFRVRAEERGLDFVCEVDDSLPVSVRGDEGKLRQALINLLGNAVKFTSSGSIRFSVRDAGGRVRFEIADSGDGIAEEELPMLFQPFVQTEAGRAAREGTGLGLAITKRIVELMGGAISVTSRKGEGSVFSVDVPLEATAEEQQAISTRRVARLARGQKVPAILVADDTVENRALLAQLLSVVGFEVRAAADGAEALAIWRSWRPELVFMDMRMPVMDGREATRRMRAEEKEEPRRTVIVALTASVFEQDREKLLADGADDVIFKPYREKAIFEVISRSLGVEYEYEDPVAQDADDGRSRRVLLTDDDRINREIAKEMLRLNAYEIVEAHDGEEALALLESNGPFDAVILDVEMPRMGGVEAVRRIRADSRYQRLPVLAMTAHTDPDDIERLKAAGMDDHISKPFEAVDLTGKLSRWIPRVSA